MPKLGKLAKASGSDLGDLADAAGDVSTALGDMAPDKKAERIDSIMRTIAGQGKIGAVEINARIVAIHASHKPIPYLTNISL